VLLTIHEVRSYYPVVNAFLRSEATARANVEVLDWNALVSANPGATAGDGLHLSPAGADLMAGAIARSVTQVEAEQAAATTSTAAPTTTTAPTTTAAPTTTVPPTTTAPPRTSTTTPPTTTAASTATTAAGVTAAPLVSPVPTPAAPRAPRPHTPRWAWPGVIAGTVALAAVLTREHRRRRAPGSSEPGPRPVR